MHRCLALSLLCALFVGAESAQPKPSDIPKPKFNHEAVEKLGWRLGCQAYTFRKLTLMDTLDVLGALGVKYVELYPGQVLSESHGKTKFNHDVPQELIDEVLAKCKAVGVTPVSYGVVPLPNDEAQCRKVFDFAKKLKLEQIVSEPPADAFELIDKLTAEYNIPVAIHDHPKPSHYWNPDTVLEACKGRSERIGACADVGHWQRSGINPIEALKKLEGHIFESHFKDLNEFGNTKAHDVPWGTGISDVRAVLDEAKRQNYKGTMMVEYEKGAGPELVENVRKCIEWYDKTTKELAGE